MPRRGELERDAEARTRKVAPSALRRLPPALSSRAWTPERGEHRRPSGRHAVGPAVQDVGRDGERRAGEGCHSAVQAWPWTGVATSCCRLLGEYLRGQGGLR